MKPAECMIGNIIKPAIKKTDYVKRSIVEFYRGENSKNGQSKYQRDGCSVTRFTLEDDVTTNQGLRLNSILRSCQKGLIYCAWTF